MDNSGSWQVEDRMKHNSHKNLNYQLITNDITALFCKHSKRRRAKASEWLSRLHCRVINLRKASSDTEKSHNCSQIFSEESPARWIPTSFSPPPVAFCARIWEPVGSVRLCRHPAKANKHNSSLSCTYCQAVAANPVWAAIIQFPHTKNIFQIRHRGRGRARWVQLSTQNTSLEDEISSYSHCWCHALLWRNTGKKSLRMQFWIPALLPRWELAQYSHPGSSTSTGNRSHGIMYFSESWAWFLPSLLPQTPRFVTQSESNSWLLTFTETHTYWSSKKHFWRS